MASCARSEHAALTKLNTTNHIGRFRIQVSSNSESRTCMAEAASPSSHSSFCEEVFSSRIRGTNEVDRTNILAPGFAFFPPSPPKFLGDWPNWEVVSSYSSATAPDSHGISCADPLFQARKER